MVVSGISIGRVKQVDLNDRGTVDLTLQLLTRYQNMVKDNSELRITKSGVVVGQTQVDIGMGTSNSPVLGDGATIRAVEPKDIADLLSEVEPVLMAVKHTLLEWKRSRRICKVVSKQAERHWSRWPWRRRICRRWWHRFSERLPRWSKRRRHSRR